MVISSTFTSEGKRQHPHHWSRGLKLKYTLFECVIIMVVVVVFIDIGISIRKKPVKHVWIHTLPKWTELMTLSHNLGHFGQCVDAHMLCNKHCPFQKGVFVEAKMLIWSNKKENWINFASSSSNIYYLKEHNTSNSQEQEAHSRDKTAVSKYCCSHSLCPGI